MLSNEELQPTQPKIDWKQAASVISSAQIVEAVESGEYVGFCTACGAEHDGIEPDAEHYLCEACDASAVFGAEQLGIYLLL